MTPLGNKYKIVHPGYGTHNHDNGSNNFWFKEDLEHWIYAKTSTGQRRRKQKAKEVNKLSTIK